MLLHVFVSLCPSFGCREFFATGGLQNGTSHLYDVTNILAFEFLNFICYQSFVSSINAIYFQAVIDGRTCDCTNGSVHSRSISSRG